MNISFITTVENGYCNYPLVTKNCDCFALLRSDSVTVLHIENGYCDYFALVPR